MHTRTFSLSQCHVHHGEKIMLEKIMLEFQLGTASNPAGPKETESQLLRDVAARAPGARRRAHSSSANRPSRLRFTPPVARHASRQPNLL